MSEPTPDSKRRPWLRFPVLVLIVAALLFGALLSWPRGQLEEMYRQAGFMIVTMLSALALSAWALFASGWRWWVRPLPVVAFWGLYIGSITSGTLTFDGDSGLIVRMPWAARDLAAERAAFEATAPATVMGVDLAAKPDDSPDYRGPSRTGRLDGPPLIPDWNATPPKVLWRRPGGGGFAGFAVANGFAVTIEQRDEGEATVCYAAADGRERWAYARPGEFKELMGGNGPRATPTIYAGDVYSLGANGHLARLDGATGKSKWTAEILEDNGNLIWGMSGSPLVTDKFVIVNPGSQKAGRPGLVAYDRESGKVAWSAGTHPAGYSSPQLATVAGKEQVLLFDGHGLAGFDPAGAGELWRVAWATNQGINVAQPIVIDDKTVFIASGYGVGGGWVEVTRAGDAFKAKIVRKTKSTQMRAKFTSPVLHAGHLYGLNDGKLECLDAATGEVKWKDDRRAKKGEAFGHGQLLVSGDRLIAQTEFGEVVLVAATPEEYRELGRLDVLKGTKSWNTPALAGGVLFARSDEELTAIDLRAK